MSEATLDRIYNIVAGTQKDVIATQKDVIATQKDVIATQRDIQQLTAKVDTLNGSVRETSEEVAVLKDWRHTLADPATKQISDIRVEVAKLAGLGGGVGLVLSIIFVLLKVVGLV